MQEYRRQLCQRPHMISTSTSNEATKSSDKKKSSSYQTRATKLHFFKPVCIKVAISVFKTIQFFFFILGCERIK